jgi:hypothetical protein
MNHGLMKDAQNYCIKENKQIAFATGPKQSSDNLNNAGFQALKKKK